MRRESAIGVMKQREEIPLMSVKASCLMNTSSFNEGEEVVKRPGGKHLYKAKHGLLCESFEERILIQCALALGSLVGCITIIAISNRFGRRWGLFTAILGVWIFDSGCC